MTKTPKTTCVKSASPDPSLGSLARKVLDEVRKGQGKGNEWEANESPERCLILVDVVVMGEEGAGVAVETKGEDQAEGEDLVLKKTGDFNLLTWQLVAQSSHSLKRNHFMKWS